MPIETQESRITPYQEGFYIPFDIQKNKNEILHFLTPIFGEEAADQLLFILEALSQDQFDDFINHCNKATQKLGELLQTSYGGEPSFFEISPNSEFYDVRGEYLQEKFGYRGSYHSIAVIEIPEQRADQTFYHSLVIDYTYDTVNKMSPEHRLLSLQPTDAEQTLSSITSHYGGKWSIEYKFDKKTKKFVYQK
jgi:hypothetical protein